MVPNMFLRDHRPPIIASIKEPIDPYQHRYNMMVGEDKKRVLMITTNMDGGGSHLLPKDPIRGIEIGACLLIAIVNFRLGG